MTAPSAGTPDPTPVPAAVRAVLLATVRRLAPLLPVVLLSSAVPLEVLRGRAPGTDVRSSPAADTGGENRTDGQG
ncbi:hypothetical protein GCM10010172_83400 [Paractinoplanes ferrugineus]|uniref:Uncharacterized protein n=1 Tax=Paractinoplanes ferrugineus TaxID=113564 RepID=A0A919IX30_9ACTN|nr:hypothetical protein [Actinoplanes ferrugineus]GIE10661.1 hypothetical protein Afe05nite_25010 [Actinoplanes ferrugineus]